MLTNDEISTWIAALRSGEYEQGHGAMCRRRDRAALLEARSLLVERMAQQ